MFIVILLIRVYVNISGMAIPRKSDDRALLVRLDSDEIVALDYLRQITRSSRAATVGWAIMEMCHRLGAEGRIRIPEAAVSPVGESNEQETA